MHGVKTVAQFANAGRYFVKVHRLKATISLNDVHDVKSDNKYLNRTSSVHLSEELLGRRVSLKTMSSFFKALSRTFGVNGAEKISRNVGECRSLDKKLSRR